MSTCASSETHASVPSVVEVDQTTRDRIDAFDRVKQQRVGQQQLEFGSVHSGTSLFFEEPREASRRRSNVIVRIQRPTVDEQNERM